MDEQQVYVKTQAGWRRLTLSSALPQKDFDFDVSFSRTDLKNVAYVVCYFESYFENL